MRELDDLRPIVGLPCSSRISQPFGGGSGYEFNRCTSKDAEAYGTQVTRCVCEACPVRNLVPRYKKLWPDCDMRKREARLEPCGCPYTVRICQHPESPSNGKQVFPKDCRACPLVKVSEEVEVQ